MEQEEYALFVIAFQVFSACQLLADAGIGIGVRSIGGRVHEDRRRLGALVNAALHLRRRMAIVSCGVCLPLGLWMLQRTGASLTMASAVLVCVLVGVVPYLTGSILRLIPWLRGRYRTVQGIELVAALARLGVIITLFAIGGLNALTATLAGATGFWMMFVALRGPHRQLADPSADVQEQDHIALVRLVRQQMPNTIFYCIQSQLVVLMLTCFANTQAIAGVGALGRIAVLLTIAQIVINQVLLPRFTVESSPRRSMAWAALVAGSAVAAGLLFIAVSLVTPRGLLWVLGPEYANLQAELAIAAAASAVQLCGSTLEAINASRANLIWHARLLIPLTLVFQLAAASIVPLNTLGGALCLSVAASSALLVAMLPDTFRLCVAAGAPSSQP